jgi:uncharacterized cupredoxin-like copper-binding protein
VRLRGFLLSLAAALAAGCGGDGDNGAAGGPVKEVAPGQPLQVVGREYTFTPARARTGEAQPLRIELDNQGSLAHNLKVFRGDRELGGTPTFLRGTRSATVRLAPGSYRMVCTVGNHEELGMVGELEVSGR